MSAWLTTDPRWHGIREERLTVNGHSVRVLRADHAVHHLDDADDGQPQLLIHGLGGSAVNWIDVMVGMSAQGPVVAVDLPGFGGTTVPEGGSARIGGNAAFIVALVRELGWPTVTLHGNSMGGLVAALAAARLGDTVAGLILTSPAIPPPVAVTALPLPRAAVLGVLPMSLPLLGPALVARGLGAMEDRDNATEAEGVDGDVLLQLLFSDPSTIRPTVLAALAADGELAAAQPVRLRAGALVEATRSIAAHWLDAAATHRELELITAPTFLIGGELDPLVSAKVIGRVGRAHAEWTTWIWPGGGHVMMLEDPDTYVSEVTRWQHTVAGGCSVTADHAGAINLDEYAFASSL